MRRVIVVLGAPIVAIVILRLEVRPLPRLLAVYVYFVLVAAGRRGFGGPVKIAWSDATPRMTTTQIEKAD